MHHVLCDVAESVGLCPNRRSRRGTPNIVEIDTVRQWAKPSLDEDGGNVCLTEAKVQRTTAQANRAR
eukprot:7445522-Alexandrium_andersonii.AAC.1